MVREFENGTVLRPAEIYQVGLKVTDSNGNRYEMRPSIWSTEWNILSLVYQVEVPLHSKETSTLKLYNSLKNSR